MIRAGTPGSGAQPSARPGRRDRRPRSHRRRPARSHHAAGLPVPPPRHEHRHVPLDASLRRACDAGVVLTPVSPRRTARTRSGSRPAGREPGEALMRVVLVAHRTESPEAVGGHERCRAAAGRRRDRCPSKPVRGPGTGPTPTDHTRSSSAGSDHTAYVLPQTLASIENAMSGSGRTGFHPYQIVNDCGVGNKSCRGRAATGPAHPRSRRSTPVGGVTMTAGLIASWIAPTMSNVTGAELTHVRAVETGQLCSGCISRRSSSCESNRPAASTSSSAPCRSRHHPAARAPGRR